MARGAKVVAEQESVHRNDEDEYHAEQNIRYKQGLAARLDGFFSVEWQLRLGFGHARNSIPPFLASARRSREQGLFPFCRHLLFLTKPERSARSRSGRATLR